MSPTRKERRLVIRHVALFRWKPQTNLDLDEVLTELREIVAAIQDDAVLVASSSLRLSSGTYDFGLSVDFADQDTYLAYRGDSRHQRLLTEVLAPAAAEIAAIQLRLG
jgi:hypothetical protein